MINKILDKVRKQKKQIKYNRELDYFSKLSSVIDLKPIDNKGLGEFKTITFVVPDMLPYSGGHTSILRLGTELFNLGYSVNYITYKNQSIVEMEKNALVNLKDYKGKMYDKSYLSSIQTDVVVSTFWESTYYAKKINGYKVYFIQDYEPYFYTFGEKFLLCKQTYDLGFHMISLGKWNKEMLKKECNQVCDFIDFPYEKSEYKYTNRNYQDYKLKNKIKIAVYVKNEEKRAPFIIQIMLDKIKETFKEKGIDLEILYFGEDKNITMKNGINLGKLSKSDLLELYKQCDFGMVASLTNISLVPYEMIATGLPVIEFDCGTFNYFFEENCCISTTFDYRTLSDNLYYYIKNPDELEKITQRALQQINNLSWKKSAKQFEEILLECINKGDRDE